MPRRNVITSISTEMYDLIKNIQKTNGDSIVSISKQIAREYPEYYYWKEEQKIKIKKSLKNRGFFDFEIKP